MGRPKKRGISMVGNPLCRTPHKRGFTSEEELLKKLCRDPKANGMHTYRCSCGYWHMGHKRRKQARV